jgi:hypothetical protein
LHEASAGLPAEAFCRIFKLGPLVVVVCFGNEPTGVRPHYNRQCVMRLEQVRTSGILGLSIKYAAIFDDDN